MRPIDADALFNLAEENIPVLSPEGTLTKAWILAALKTKSVTPTIDAEPVVRWISVKDRLPEKSGDVLVCSRGYCLPVPYSQRWKAFNASDYDDGTKHALNSVTHWMPLPEMPEEEDA